jgi:hypothetical protein
MQKKSVRTHKILPTKDQRIPPALKQKTQAGLALHSQQTLAITKPSTIFRTAIILFAFSNECNSTTNEPSFQIYREHLKHEDWLPFRFTHRETDDFPVTGEEAELIERKIFEVESCSMDGGALCTFWYTKKGSCLKVTTRGEDLKSMRVISRKPNTCPE